MRNICIGIVMGAMLVLLSGFALCEISEHCSNAEDVEE